MKTHFTSFVFLLFATAIVNGQYYFTTIKTPKNVSVEAIVQTEAPDPVLATWESLAAQWIIDHGLQNYAFRIGPASNTYNCHSYAWHKSDGGSTVWVDQNDINNNPNVSKYWTGSNYTFSSTNQTLGTKVFLQTGDHSMMASTTNPGWYESKWGPWPLYRHTLTAHPYNMTNPQYFKVNISGSSFICSSGQSTYSTLSISGASYSWTGDYITITGSGSSVTGTGNGNGSGDVKTSITSPFSGTTIKGMFSVWVGPPLIQNKKVDGVTYTTGMQVCPGNHALTVTPVGGNASNAIWTVPSGITYIIGNNECDFVFPSTASSVSITCYSTNSCGTGSNSAFYLTKKSYGCSGFLAVTVYPNPATEEVTITLVPEKVMQVASSDSIVAEKNDNIDRSLAVYNISIYNKESKLMSKYTRSGDSFSVPLTNLKDGIYLLEISDGKNLTTKQIVVKH